MLKGKRCGNPLMSRLLVALSVTVLAAGCGADRKVSSAPQTPAPPPVEAKPLVIEADAAGPIRLGMTREQAAKVDGFNVSAAALRLEGSPAPVLRYVRSGEVAALAELKAGRVSRIRVLSAQFHTPEGVQVGSTARELAKPYGAGKVFAGEGNVCAVFARAPGRSFCFRTTPDLLVKPDWKKVAARNPTVEVILIVPVK